MKARQKADKSIRPHRSSWIRWALWSLGGLFGAGLFTMIGVGLWFQNSLNRFKTFEAETRAAYKGLNEEFPFEIGDGTRTASSDRLEAYFRARSVTLEAMPAQVNQLTETFLRNGSIRRIELLRGFTSAMEPLRRASRTHIAQLRSEQMSLNEYLWLHGLVVHEIYRNEDARREQLAKVVEKLDRALESSDWIEDGGFRAEDFAKGLDIAYGGITAPPSEELSAMKIGNTTACVIDVLAANHTRVARERSESESGS